MGNSATKETLKSSVSTTTLYVIGFNEDGDLGLKHTNNVNQLTDWNQANKNIMIKDVSKGLKHTIFRDSNNELWGAGNKIALGIDINKKNKTFSTPQKITFFKENNIQINKICADVTSTATFWITNDKTLYASGKNQYHQLGLGLTDDCMFDIYPGKDTHKPAIVDTLTNVIHVQQGTCHSVAICGPSLSRYHFSLIITHWHRTIPNGIIDIIECYHHDPYALYSAGRPKKSLSNHQNWDYGQDGHGIHGINFCRANWNIIDVLTDKHITKVSCGYWYSLFVSKTGTIYGCGRDIRSNTIISPIAVVHSKLVIVEIQSGFCHNLCIDANYKIYSFGRNTVGQCGHGVLTPFYHPQLIQNLSQYKITVIKCGWRHSYAQTEEQYHFLFGDNQFNECSLAQNAQSEVPFPYRIDDIFADITQSKIIKDVYLGNNSTFILSGNFNEE